MLPQSVLHNLYQRALLKPEARAFWQRGRAVTYGELWQGVLSVRTALKALGIQKGDRIALFLPNSPEYAMAYYGIQSLGAAVVALNRDSRAPNVVNLVKHCGARLLLVEAAYTELEPMRTLLGDSCPVLPVAQLLESAPQPLVATELNTIIGDAQGLAMILYTSGTTGNPKGVMLSHQNLASNTQSIIQALQLTSEDSVLCVLSFFYSFGNSLLHSNLSAGASLVLEDGMLYPQRIIQTMREMRVTGFSGVPWMYATLLRQAQFSGEPENGLSALRYMSQAGAAMPLQTIERIRELFPKIHLYVMYGQTEATARLTTLPPQTPAEWEKRRGSVGPAIAEVRLEIRREDGSRAPIGICGDVWASGPNIMLGYWGIPLERHENLRVEPSGRWLRTGDIGRMDQEGHLYLQGRSSEMIKTGAHRVSPLEIEEVLLWIKGVREAAAVGVPDAVLGEVVGALLVHDGTDMTEKSVLAHCRKYLASYMMPKKVRFVTSLPKTPTGKLQRNLLAKEMSHADPE